MAVFILPTKFTTANSTQQCFFPIFWGEFLEKNTAGLRKEKRRWSFLHSSPFRLFLQHLSCWECLDIVHILLDWLLKTPMDSGISSPQIVYCIFMEFFLPYFLSNKSIKYIEQIVRGLGVLSNRFTPSALSRFLGTSSSLGKKTSTKEGVKRASLKNRQWQWGSRKVHFSSGKWSEGITVMTLSRDHFAGRRFYENV